MTGDQADCLARIKATLPTGWFPDDTPLLDGVLNGCAVIWSWAYALLGYMKQQARLATMTGVWLDMFARDFFGSFIARRVNEADTPFRARIKRELFREKGTRNGVIRALTDLTGRAPKVFEPAYPMDTGGYSDGTWTGFAWNTAGGWGSLQLPFQFFVTAYRPTGSGVAMVGGWYAGSGWAGGGYGVGAIQWVSRDMIVGQVTDAMIYAEVNDVRPVASIAWTAISD